MNKRLLHLFEFSRQTLEEIALQIPFSMSRYILWQPNAFLIGGDNCQRFVLASLDYSWEMCFEKRKRIKKTKRKNTKLVKLSNVWVVMKDSLIRISMSLGRFFCLHHRTFSPVYLRHSLSSCLLLFESSVLCLFSSIKRFLSKWVDFLFQHSAEWIITSHHV